MRNIIPGLVAPAMPLNTVLNKALLSLIPSLSAPPPSFLGTNISATNAYASIAQSAGDSSTRRIEYELCMGESTHTRARPRPLQGGKRISLHWLYHDIDDLDCQWQFRFTRAQLLALVQVLDVPDPFVTTDRSSFSALEALCLLLARFRTAGNIYDLVKRFDRSAGSISLVINELVQHLDNRWSHLLDFDADFLLHPTRLQSYADAVHQAGCPVPTIIAFIDDTIRRICRPTYFQRVLNNGHAKEHALKYQALALPNGLIGHLYGPVEGRRNDNYLLSASEVVERLKQFAVQAESRPDQASEDRFLHVYGDAAYGCTDHIISPFPGADTLTADERAWNTEMGRLRIIVEHSFGDVVNNWPFLNAFWKLRLFSSPVGRYYRVAVLLTNAHNCLTPNKTSHFFKCPPPTIFEYFHD